ncbi:PIN domain-containing protein [Kitasatospora sp. P5_F3]
MIVLDTNTIRSAKTGGPEEELLRTLRASRAERVGMPRTVLDELLAQHVLAYQRAHEASVSAAEQLNKATPWKTVDGPDDYDPNRVRQHWIERYQRVAEVLETRGPVLQLALTREAGLIPPCKLVGEGKNQYKTGARDAAIWLTAVDYAKRNPTESVYFVSNNSKDFGKKIGDVPQLSSDIKGMEGRFFLHLTLGSVLAQFGKEVPTTEEEVRGLLNRPESLGVVTRRARLMQLRRRVEVPRINPVYLPFVARLSEEARATLAEVTTPRSFEIDGARWFTASARWLLLDEQTSPAGAPLLRLWSWTTRVMVAPDSHDVTVLQADLPTDGSEEDRARFPVVEGSWTTPESSWAFFGDVVSRVAATISSSPGTLGGPAFHGDLSPVLLEDLIDDGE